MKPRGRCVPGMSRAGIGFALAAVLLGLGACSADSPMAPRQAPLRIPAVNISGGGSSRVGRVEITDGAGYCFVDGDSIPAMVYQAQFWAARNLTVFHVVAPTASDLHVLYFYSAADTLSTIWHESYTNTLAAERAQGATAYHQQTVWSTPDLACLTGVPADSQLVPGLTISGSQIQWSAGAGAIEIENRDYDLFPFQMVDCSYCGATDNDGWYEVHSVLRGPQHELEFGILYLFVAKPGQVSLYYRIQLCEVGLGSSVVLAADWGVARSGRDRIGPLLRPPVAR